MSNFPSRPMAYACLALSMSLVGAYVALTKPLTMVLPVLLLGWMRFGIGGIAMLRWMSMSKTEPGLSPQKIGRAHVCTPVPNAHLVCRLLLKTKKHITTCNNCR